MFNLFMLWSSWTHVSLLIQYIFYLVQKLYAYVYINLSLSLLLNLILSLIKKYCINIGQVDKFDN